MLRELMVVIRIWGLLKPSCLPVYTATSDTQDSMSLLFRLLTKLWICCETLPSAYSFPTKYSCRPSTWPELRLLTISPARGVGLTRHLRCQRAAPQGGSAGAVWVPCG